VAISVLSNAFSIEHMGYYVIATIVTIIIILLLVNMYDKELKLNKSQRIIASILLLGLFLHLIGIFHSIYINTLL
jgi:hypothetical membrane protein